MGDAQRGDDALYFYAADLGPTRALAVNAVAGQLPDVDGPLVPGRYLLHVVDQAPGRVVTWVRTGKFEKGVNLDISAGVPWFPLRADGMVALEVHVRKGHNDRIAAITDTGSSTLYITRVSRDA